uniref:Uncharacterized protein n=1 Tax=Setaria viridis TaxID=4556 RepID=A0A4U6TX48_SETVI|nr:hypothetical protein SEVIR_7G309466v2 [Setaria viridis]
MLCNPEPTSLRDAGRVVSPSLHLQHPPVAGSRRHLLHPATGSKDFPRCAGAPGVRGDAIQLQRHTKEARAGVRPDQPCPGAEGEAEVANLHEPRIHSRVPGALRREGDQKTLGPELAHREVVGPSHRQFSNRAAKSLNRQIRRSTWSRRQKREPQALLLRIHSSISR